MSALPPIRVACLGAGYFAQFHFGAWARLPGVELVGVADLNIAAAKATGLRAFDNLDAMINTVKPDVLDIILPPSEHAKSVQAALDVGIKTIICQKPFCVDLAEAERVTEAADAAGATLIIHENFRFMPWYRAIRDALAAGKIGVPMQATFRLRPGDGQGPDAYLDRQPYFQKMPQFLIHETAVHWIDTFRFLFGTPTAVYADLRKLNPVIAGEDAGTVIFDHPSGVRTIFDGNRLADHAADNLRRTMGEGLFEGTEGTLMLHGDGSVTYRRFGSMTQEILHPADMWQGFGGDCVYHLQAHVLRHLRTGSTLENTSREYLDVTRVRNAIYASAASGRKIQL